MTVIHAKVAVPSLRIVNNRLRSPSIGMALQYVSEGLEIMERATWLFNYLLMIIIPTLDKAAIW